MESVLVHRPAQLLELLRRLRAARGRVRFLDGALRIGALAGLWLWGTFLLDWSLELPRAIRALHLAAGLFALGYALRACLGGLRRPVADAWLTARVEETAGDSDQALITAVQLTDPASRHARHYSPALLARTVRQAEEQAAHLEASRLVSRSGLHASLAISGVLALTLAGMALRRPDLAATWVERDLFLAGVDWPREYLFELVEPAGQETLVAIGDPVNVVARRVRGGDVRVSLEATYDGGERESFGLEKKDVDLYRKLFRNVSRDFRFRIDGGDFRSAEYGIRVRHRPRVEDVELLFDYPGYTGLPDVTTPSLDLGGHVKVPTGTVVRYIARASIPVSSAIFRREWREGKDERVAEEPRPVAEGTRIEGEFVAEREGFYSFRLVSLDGFENRNPVRYRIALIQDRAPSVQIVAPGRNIEVGTRATFPIRVEAEDDYGIVSSVLVFRTAAAEGDAQRERRESLPGAAALARAVKGELVLDLEQWQKAADAFPVAPGVRIEYSAECRDSLEQTGTSKVFVITVLRDEDLIRLFQDELIAVRERLQDLLENQKEARNELGEVLSAAQLAGGKLEPKSAAGIRHVRTQQEKINDRLGEGHARLAELVSRVRENRLEDAVKELPWIGGLRDKLGAIHADLAARTLAALDGLGREAARGDATSEGIGAAVDGMVRLEKAIAELVQELGEWSDIRTTIRKLEELIRHEQDLEQRVEERLKNPRSG